MSTERNKDLIHRMYEALNAQDLDAHDEYWTEDMIWHGPPGFGDIHGLDGFKYEVLKPFYTSFPDYYVENEIEVADEEWVAATGILTGTHHGEWLGIPPTGKPVTMRYSDFWLVRDGKLAENWVMVDHLGVLQQLGVISMDWKFEDEVKRSQENMKTFNAVTDRSRSAKRNLQLVHDMVDVLVAPERDKDAQKEFWTEDMIWHGPPGFGDIHGLAAFKQEVLSAFYGAFPDYYGEIDIELADENWVAATGFVTGTHRGDWLGIPATGKPIEMRYSDFWLVRDGKLAENWVMVDHIGVLRQLGVDPLMQKGEE